jgi:hypothetical protein
MHVLALALLVGLVGCSPRAATPPPRAGALERGNAKVVVLPFRAGRGLVVRDERAVEVEIPATANPVGDEIGAEFALRLAESLAQQGFTVVNSDARTGGRAYDSELAGRVATRVGAPFAVLGIVTRYEEREGNAWAVERPASVGYEVALIRAADGAVLRLDRFDYTQRALSENLLDLPRFLEGGGRWLTREDIRDGALRKTAERFAAAAAVR